MKKRIWELDALRGLFILGMVLVHLLYDLTEFYGLPLRDSLGIQHFLLRWGGVLFFLISGICATLGSRHTKRGLLVLGAGMLLTAGTILMVKLRWAEPSLIIYFGVLHCLGVCMLLWPLFRKLPPWALLVLGLAIAGFGLYADRFIRTETYWLVPLGFYPPSFASSDYFPLLPNLGYFLFGAFLGRTVYKNKESRLPGANLRNPVIRFLLLCGKHSLVIYLIHQPIITGALALIFYLIQEI